MNKLRSIAKYKSLAINDQDSLQSALVILEQTGQQVVVVTNNSKKVVGLMTDGDVRRAFLQGCSLETKVSKIMNKNPICADYKATDAQVLQIMKSNGIRHIPIVNNNNSLRGFKVLTPELFMPSESKIMVIIAGGKGTRMMPHTADCPKPLVKVNDKPIIQHIIENARDNGFYNFFVSVNYLAEKIESFLGDGLDFGVKIKCFRENSALGTAGALSLIADDLPQHIVVTNGDIITTLNYSYMLQHHIDRNADATMATRKYTIYNQYGVVETKDDQITGFSEKPQYHSIINAGVYCLSKRTIKLLVKNEYCDMPTLFLRAIDIKLRTSTYPLYEDWSDIGNPTDLMIAEKKLS